MREIVAGKPSPSLRGELDRLEAWDVFDGQPLKRELIEALPEDETISIYTQGNFTDLCRGPARTARAASGAFKLTKIAGAYWRGDSRARCSSASTAPLGIRRRTSTRI